MSVWMSFVACRRRFPEVHQRAKSDQVKLLYTKWNQLLVSVINLTDLAIKRIIKMAKQISAFTRVCQEDQVGLWDNGHQAHLSFRDNLFLQVSLLKGGCTELMILRSVVNFDSEQNAWQVEIPFLLSLQFSSPDTRKFGQKGSQHGCPKGWVESTLFIGCDENYWEPSWKSDLNDWIFLELIWIWLDYWILWGTMVCHWNI